MVIARAAARHPEPVRLSDDPAAALLARCPAYLHFASPTRPLALEALREIIRKLPCAVYQAKGVIYSADVPQRRAVLQVVGRRVDISIQEGWGQRASRTQVVAIGAAGSIDASLLESTFASCISPAVADT